MGTTKRQKLAENRTDQLLLSKPTLQPRTVFIRSSSLKMPDPEDNSSYPHFSLVYCLDRPYLSNNFGGPVFAYTRAVLDAVLLTTVIAVNTVLIFAIYFYRRKNRGTARVWNSGTSMKFVQMLAVSDVLVGVTTPLYLVPHYFCDINDMVRGEEYLCIGKYAANTFSALMSNTSLICIAVDRFVAIQYTLQYRVIMTHRVCHSMIIGQVVFSLVISGVLFWWNLWAPGSYCDLEDIMPVVYILSVGIVCHGTILVTVVGVHVQLHRKASESASRRSIVSTTNSSNSSCRLRVSREDSNCIKSAKVVILVAGVYIFCWTPYSICLMTRIAQGGTNQLTEFIFQLIVPLSYANSAVNPFIYAWKNSEIQNAVVWSIRRAST